MSTPKVKFIKLPARASADIYMDPRTGLMLSHTPIGGYSDGETPHTTLWHLAANPESYLVLEGNAEEVIALLESVNEDA